LAAAATGAPVGGGGGLEMTAVMEVVLFGSLVGALDGVEVLEMDVAVGARVTSTVGRRCEAGVRGWRTMIVVGGGKILAAW
jgi:hypothetical protein